MYGYEADKLLCGYQEITRKGDFKVDYSERRELLLNGSKIYSDFVYVSCTNFAGIAFYTNIHCHIFVKPEHNLSSALKNDSEKFYNVLILGIDSLSRLSFMRQLPKTYQFLTKKLNAFILRGLTKVGDNTFPNLIAMLTGKSVLNQELPHIHDPKEPYDSWPFVWKNFSRAGYATLFAEDRPDINLLNYYRGGLQKSPTDHYMRPFWLAVQSSMLHRISSSFCFGNIPKHLLQLRYTQDFVKKYSSIKRPFFAFSFLVELSHDYISHVSSADADLEAWLKQLFHSGYLNRTFLFFLSDHGHRFDALRATLIGRIEERMPFFAVVVPHLLSKNQNGFIQNLRTNQGRLTTPYDAYFSLLDILSHSINHTVLGSIKSDRGSTLFGPVSSNRTCSTAGIPDHYCTCETEENLDISDSRSQKAAITLVTAINNLISKSYKKLCAELSLAEIIRADLILPRREVIVNSRLYFGNLVEDGRARGMITKVTIILRTVPGNALFEGTLILREDEDNVTVLGDISRINVYGNQSSCIDDVILKKYCYCITSEV
ncbi:hypothetical protein X975_11082, partial [Stegodyphus mimosarum]